MTIPTDPKEKIFDQSECGLNQLIKTLDKLYACDFTGKINNFNEDLKELRESIKGA